MDGLTRTNSPLSRGETNRASTVSDAGPVPCLLFPRRHRILLFRGTATALLIWDCLRGFGGHIGSGGLLTVMIGGNLDTGKVNDLSGRSGCLLNHVGDHRLLIPWWLVWAFDRLLDGWISLPRGRGCLRWRISFRACVQFVICHLLTSFVMA